MDLQKIAKVLALAASDNETEALHALRTAKRLLEAEGADFVELANQIGGATSREALEDAVFDLRNEVRHLRCENERLKQGRGMPAAPGAEPSSMFDAARAASDVIRLRAELVEATDTLERERAQLRHVLANEASLHHALQEALAEAAQAKNRQTESDTRRMRLEAENRRLLHANHALSVELEEAKAAKPVAEAFVPPPVRVVEAPVAAVMEKKTRGRRAHGGASQYALF